MANSERASVQLPPEAMRRVEEIAKEENISQAEVLRRAFSVFDWLTNQVNDEKEMVFQNEAGQLEVHHHSLLPKRKKTGRSISSRDSRSLSQKKRARRKVAPV